jgi:hypothetical protein
MKSQKPQATPDTAGLIEDAKRIMGRLVTTPVEPHKTMVERRKAAKTVPKPARRKK